jgi:hypothetical protein
MANPTAPPDQNSFDASKMYVWIKSLEGKVNNLTREVDLLKGNIVKRNEDTKKELKTMSDDLLELKREQQDMLQKMDLIIKELKQTAGVEQVTVLKKYIDLWNPMNFVTQRDLDRAIEAKIELLKSKGEHK